MYRIKMEFYLEEYRSRGNNEYLAFLFDFFLPARPRQKLDWRLTPTVKAKLAKKKKSREDLKTSFENCF